MSEKMQKLEEIFKNTRLDWFVMAISHLMMLGWNTAKEITDEQIEAAEGNGLMSKEFVVWINKTAREIAKSCDPSQLVIFCMHHEIYATDTYYDDARQKKIEHAIDAINDLNGEFELDNDDLPYVLETYLADVDDAIKAVCVEQK